MNVEVQMAYDGDMTMDCSGSTGFSVTAITAYDADGNKLTDADASAAAVSVHDLTHGGGYTFVIEGDGSSGTADIKILCSSDAPTKTPTTAPSPDPTASPSTDPTVGPSNDPTTAPSEDPSVSPTREPTMSPSNDPTTSPSADPSASPTTPAPSHPDELECGDHVNGTYNGEAVKVEVRMLHDGDMTINCSGSTGFSVTSITAYDSNGDVLMVSDASASTLTIHDLTHGGDYSFTIEGPSDVRGIFDIVIECSSDSPTTSPSAMPTNNPTTNPTMKPTTNPSTDPTIEPTTNPSVPPVTPTEDPTTSGYTTSVPTTVPTTGNVYPGGCCTGDSKRVTTRCMRVDTESACTRRSSCHWIVTPDASDCEWNDDHDPTDSGCCVAMDSLYEDNCKDFYTEDDCASDQCYWTPTSDNYDCSKLWEEPTGCCKSGSGRRNPRCPTMTTESSCDSMRNVFVHYLFRIMIIHESERIQYYVHVT